MSSRTIVVVAAAACGLWASVALATPPRDELRRHDGALPEAVIRAHLRDHRSDVHACLALASRRGDTVPARIDVELLIEPGGRVQSARVSSPTGGTSSLARCVTARARTWSFPPAPGHSRTRAPFVLQ